MTQIEPETTSPQLRFWVGSHKVSYAKCLDLPETGRPLLIGVGSRRRSASQAIDLPIDGGGIPNIRETTSPPPAESRYLLGERHFSLTIARLCRGCPSGLPSDEGRPRRPPWPRVQKPNRWVRAGRSRYRPFRG